jgi:hypothetical protein
MVTKAHTSIPAREIDAEMRRRGCCVVHLPNTAIRFEISVRGVEVNADGMRYVMQQQRDLNRDCITFRVTVDGRWECLAAQEGFDGMSYFEVLDKAGDPFADNNRYQPGPSSLHWERASTQGECASVGAKPTWHEVYERNKKLLLC